MNNRKKYVVVCIAGVLLALAGIGFYQYNKPAKNVEDASGKQIASEALYHQFSIDSIAAKKAFIQQVVEVSGTVTQVSPNQQNNTVVLLNTGTASASVNCTMEGPAKDVAVGSNIRIKGICSGMGEGDADLGIAGDVYLVRCYLAR